MHVRSHASQGKDCKRSITLYPWRAFTSFKLKFYLWHFLRNCMYRPKRFITLFPWQAFSSFKLKSYLRYLLRNCMYRTNVSSFCSLDEPSQVLNSNLIYDFFLETAYISPNVCEITNLVVIFRKNRWKMPLCWNLVFCHRLVMTYCHGYALMTLCKLFLNWLGS